MAVALMLALQAAAPAMPAGTPPIAFDLADVAAAADDATAPGLRRACRGDEPDEIVVCGRRPGGGDYPLDEMARIFEPRPAVAETDIGGGARARAYVESYAMPDGTISKRVMVGVRVPF